MKYEYSHGGVSEALLREKVHTLRIYCDTVGDVIRNKNYGAPEAAFVVPYDTTAHVSFVRTLIDALGPVKQVVLIGIGGSSMGTAAVYEALRTPHTPVLHILDVLDAEKVDAVIETLTQSVLTDFAVVVISKSGSTTETLANTDVLITTLMHTFGTDLYKRVVCVGNKETSLARYAQERSMHYAAIPENVGGRFSVFSYVGLVPLALLGFDIEAFSYAAQGVFERGIFVHEDTEEEDQSALYAAAIVETHIALNARIYALFLEHDRLLAFGAWYQQLLAESLGKITKEGKKVGLAPVCMSPRELHSTAQLYLSGYPDVLTQFIGLSIPLSSAYTISETECGARISMKGKRAYERLPQAIMSGVHAAYEREGLPHMRISVETLSAETLGMLMAEKMLEVACAAHLLQIDAFDQPHVELYKKETRRILESE